MTAHSSVLAWRIPGTGEPGGLRSMGSHSRTRLKRLSSSSIQGASLHYRQVLYYQHREPACQCRRHKRCGFELWVRKIPQSRARQGTITHSSILAWRILWTEEPGRLQSVGLQSRLQLKRFSTAWWISGCEVHS